MERTVIPYNCEYSKSKFVSTYTMSSGLIKAASLRDDVEMVLFMPEWVKEPDWWGTNGKGCITVVQTKNDAATDVACGYANPSWRGALYKRSDYFLCMTQRVTAGPLLQKMLGKPFVGFHPKIVNYVATGDFKEPHFLLSPSTIMESIGSYAINWNIFFNQDHFARTQATMSKVFQPSVIKGFRSRSKVITLGVDTDLIESFPPTKSDGAFVMIYGGRPATHKRLDLMVEVAKILFSLGIPARLELFLSLEGAIDADKKFVELSSLPYVRVHPADQADYYGMCRTADVFLGTSTAESYGIAYVEAMYGGATGVFWHRDWVKSLIPARYPYMVKDVQEAVAVCLHLFKTRGTDEHRGFVANMQEHVRKHHSRKMHYQGVLDSVVALSNGLRDKKNPKTWKELGV